MEEVRRQQGHPPGAGLDHNAAAAVARAALVRVLVAEGLLQFRAGRPASGGGG
jgi:hypothetical protein